MHFLTNWTDMTRFLLDWRHHSTLAPAGCGIKFDLESEDAVKVITDYLIRELGTKFPELTRKEVEEFTRKRGRSGKRMRLSKRHRSENQSGRT
ncbi:hypothetical protein FH581_024500 (plasmid) [Leptospira weilii]|uniref:hypothetical protein n=1 Tax=Leptospira weilii TaxID=28184 RepID=UPI00201B6D99|nr:hypothetical protein [Leptospira weilii]UPY80852.1 hypothetical protein FH581_024500 [Leptospira weilii]